MFITSVGEINAQVISHSKKKKTNLLTEETSCKGENGYSKGTLCSRDFYHEKEDSCFKNTTSEICENNPKQGQHFPNWQRSLQQHFNEEWWRLLTFARYPSTAECSSILLARQGFIYCGKGDSVDHTFMCVFCSSMLKNLDKNVDIGKMHRAVNPNCPFVRGLEYQNKSIPEYGEGKFDEIFARIHHLRKVKSSPTPQCHDQGINSLVASVPTITPSSPSQNIVSNDAQHLSCNSSQYFVSNETHKSTEQRNGTSQLVTNHASTLSFPWQDRSHTQERSDSYMVNSVDENLLQGEMQHNTTTLESRIEGSPSPHNTSLSTASLANERGNGPSSLCPPGNSMYSETQPQNTSLQSFERTQGHRSNNSSSVPSNNGSLSSESSSVPDSFPDQDVKEESMQSSHVSYDKLGIITSHPKRPEYAVEVNRLESFHGWPVEHHIQPEDLARAGYFFTGYSDCARCFHCGGGLRNWEISDNIWVEHARWFPNCAFMRQTMGQGFIDAVQHLNKEQEIISFDDVMAEMQSRGLENSLSKGIEDNLLEIRRDPAVRVIIDNGFSEEDTVRAVQNLKERDQLLGADLLYEELLKQGVTRQSDDAKYFNESPSVSQRSNEKRDRETLEDIKDKISEMRQLSLCKICMDKEVSVLFLPCGHFVSCNNCSFALQCCPFCREKIKGVVRAFLN